MVLQKFMDVLPLTGRLPATNSSSIIFIMEDNTMKIEVRLADNLFDHEYAPRRRCFCGELRREIRKVYPTAEIVVDCEILPRLQGIFIDGSTPDFLSAASHIIGNMFRHLFAKHTDGELTVEMAIVEGG